MCVQHPCQAQHFRVLHHHRSWFIASWMISKLNHASLARGNKTPARLDPKRSKDPFTSEFLQLLLIDCSHPLDHLQPACPEASTLWASKSGCSGFLSPIEPKTERARCCATQLRRSLASRWVSSTMPVLSIRGCPR